MNIKIVGYLLILLVIIVLCLLTNIPYYEGLENPFQSNTQNNDIPLVNNDSCNNYKIPWQLTSEIPDKCKREIESERIESDDKEQKAYNELVKSQQTWLEENNVYIKRSRDNTRLMDSAREHYENNLALMNKEITDAENDMNALTEQYTKILDSKESTLENIEADITNITDVYNDKIKGFNDQIEDKRNKLKTLSDENSRINSSLQNDKTPLNDELKDAVRGSRPPISPELEAPEKMLISAGEEYIAFKKKKAPDKLDIEEVNILNSIKKSDWVKNTTERIKFLIYSAASHIISNQPIMSDNCSLANENKNIFKYFTKTTYDKLNSDNCNYGYNGKHFPEFENEGDCPVNTFPGNDGNCTNCSGGKITLEQIVYPGDIIPGREDGYDGAMYVNYSGAKDKTYCKDPSGLRQIPGSIVYYKKGTRKTT